MTYRILLALNAKRAIEADLLAVVAAAVWEFTSGSLVENPHGVGKPLTGLLTGLWSARR